MAIPELLIGSVFSGGAVQVGELVGGTSFNQFGANLPNTTAVTLGSSEEANVVNRIIEYRGAVYAKYSTAAFEHSVARYDRELGTWSTVLTVATSSVGRDADTGLFIANTATTSRLFFAHHTSLNKVQISYTDDGTTWFQSAEFLATNEANDLDDSPWLMFNNKLYGAVGVTSSTDWIEIDPVALTISSGSAPWFGGSNSTSIDFCIFDDRLFALAADAAYNANADWALYEFIGSGWALNTQITTGGGTGDGIDNTAANFGAVCLFKDPNQNALIAIVPTGDAAGNNAGSQMFELAQSGSAFTPTNITNTVIPVALRPGARGVATTHSQDRWYAFVSNDDPTVTEEVYLFFAIGPAPGTSYSVYQFVNVSTLLSAPFAGPNTIFSIPSSKNGGGSRISGGATTATGKPTYEFREAIPNGIRIYYRLEGGTATAPISGTVRAYYSQSQETPRSLCTLFGSVSGGTLNGNQVDNVEADGGGTLYYLEWASPLNGVPSGDQVHIVLDFD